MTDQEAFDILEGAIGMIEGEWGEGDGSEGSALSHIRARLTTAETERDYQQAQADEWRDRAFAAKDVLKTANDNCERLDGERAAAEARVEALSEALQDASKALQQISMWGNAGLGAGTYAEKALTRARAALACPPQQRVTHGRHCPCSGCGREDWTRPELAPCGMHGPDCPAVYAPAACPPPSAAGWAARTLANAPRLPRYLVPMDDVEDEAFTCRDGTCGECQDCEQAHEARMQAMEP